MVWMIKSFLSVRPPQIHIANIHLEFSSYEFCPSQKELSEIWQTVEGKACYINEKLHLACFCYYHACFVENSNVFLILISRTASAYADISLQVT